MTKHVEVMDLGAQMKARRAGVRPGGLSCGRCRDAARPGRKRSSAPTERLPRAGSAAVCARGAVAEGRARLALADGEPPWSRCSRKICWPSSASSPAENREGVRFATNMCPSKGTMDVFIEPVLPHPSLVVLGGSPVALSLGRASPFSSATTSPSRHLRPTCRDARRRHGDRWFCIGKTERGKTLRSWSRPGQGDEAGCGRGCA